MPYILRRTKLPGTTLERRVTLSLSLPRFLLGYSFFLSLSLSLRFSSRLKWTPGIIFVERKHRHEDNKDASRALLPIATAPVVAAFSDNTRLRYTRPYIHGESLREYSGLKGRKEGAFPESLL